MSTTPGRARGVAIGGALVLSIATAAGPAAPANAKIKCNSQVARRRRLVSGQDCLQRL
ncbi:MAG: hypothetical protein QOI48_3005 [Solirubrobacteraceae bacterium]|jgi:hypothetical protein|nr:hypothetical protein [Solirubrobacteraceae bacterium]